MCWRTRRGDRRKDQSVSEECSVDHIIEWVKKAQEYFSYFKHVLQKYGENGKRWEAKRKEENG